MDEWRQNLEDKLQKKSHQEADKQNEKEDREKQKKLRWLQQSFSCHICGKLPTGPRNSHWSKPDNLEMCVSCGKWFCKEHYHKPSNSYQIYCKNCAENLEVSKPGDWIKKSKLNGFIFGFVLSTVLYIISGFFIILTLASAWIGLIIVRNKHSFDFTSSDYFLESCFKGMLSSTIAFIIVLVIKCM